MSVFLQFHPRLQAQIVNRLGWRSLRPVQEQASRTILDGFNSIILAPTAGGKTEAAMFPVISRMLDDEPATVGALYICPIRALLNNQEERLGVYTKMVGLDRFKWHGDTTARQRKTFVEEPAALLMTTPESLEVMMISPKFPTKKVFSDLRFVIVDEVHAFAGSDRGAHLVCLLERLRQYTPHDFQRIGLSATVGNPDDIMNWLQGSSKNRKAVINPERRKGNRTLLVALDKDVPRLCRNIAQTAAGKKSLLFCESRALTEQIADQLKRLNIDTYVHHSAVSKEERERAEARFAEGSSACIVCTSTLELGIDIGDLDYVFQLDTASTVSSFLQRLGRTGRREGTVSNTFFFCTEGPMSILASAIIEMARSGWVENVSPSRRTWHILIHQLMAMCLQHGSVTRLSAWNVIAGAYSLSNINRDEYEQLIDHLVREAILYEESGRLSMGVKAESVFGRKNFMEIYSVFTSPEQFTVMTVTEHELGTLQNDFVEKLLEGETTFLLAGRAWLVDRIQFKQKRVIVRPAPRGRIPTWSSICLKLLGYEICRKMKDIMSTDMPTSYLDPVAKDFLMEVRQDIGPFLASADAPISVEGDGIIWHTYAGGQINHTLKFALQHETGWKITVNNEVIKFRDTTINLKRLNQALYTIWKPDYWERSDVIADVLNMMPKYRLSKFQFCLLDRLQKEIISSFLLDIPGTIAFLKRVEQDHKLNSGVNVLIHAQTDNLEQDTLE
jgi:ATP-dependent helicase Lhr and Lhr-like helicase